MLADASLADLGLVAIGGAIGVIGSYFTHRWSRGERAIERLAACYADWVSAIDETVRCSYAVALHRLSSRKANEKSPDSFFLQRALKYSEQEQEAKTKLVTAFFRLCTYESDRGSQNIVKDLHAVVLGAVQVMAVAESRDATKKLMSDVRQQTSKFIDLMQGRFF